MHPFSLSSAPDDPALRISVRMSGDLTSHLPELREGDGVTLMGPYGKFGERSWIRGPPNEYADSLTLIEQQSHDVVAYQPGCPRHQNQIVHPPPYCSHPADAVTRVGGRAPRSCLRGSHFRLSR